MPLELGEGLGTTDNGIVMNQTAIDKGLRIGDTVTVDRLGEWPCSPNAR